MTWIYKTMPLEAHRLTEVELNRLGQDGWQLICTMPTMIFVKVAPGSIPVPNQKPKLGARALLRANEAAEYLGISRTLVYALLSTGEIAAIKIGKATRISIAELDEWITKKRDARTFGTL